MKIPKVGDIFIIDEGDFKFEAVVVAVQDPIPGLDTDYWIQADYIKHPYGLIGGLMSANDSGIAKASWHEP